MNPKIGQTEDGYSFIGGNPADKNSWMQVGTVEEGHQFLGGDPSSKDSWKPIEVATPQVQQPEAPTFMDRALETGEDTAKALGKGSSFGFSDEIAGAFGALVDPAVTRFQEMTAGVPSDFMEKIKPLGERYTEARDYARKDYEKSAERSPIATTTGEIGGAIATGIATGGQSLGALGAEGAAFGLGESEADLTKGEFGQAALDTGKGAAIGAGTGLVMKGLGKAGKGIYNKFKGKMKPSQGDLASDAAGDILELTPKQRRVMMEKKVPQKEGPAKSVYQELPDFLKKEGGYGFFGSVKKAANNVDESLNKAGKAIESIENQYDEVMDRAIKMDKLGKSFDNFKKALGDESLGATDDVLKNINVKGVKANAPKNQSIRSAKEIIGAKGNEFGYDFNRLANKLEAELLEPIKNIPGYETQVKKVGQYISSLKNKGKIVSLKELQDFRKKTDKLIKGWEKSPEVLPQYTQMLKQVRNDITTHVKETMLKGFDDLAEELYKAGKIGKAEYNKMGKLRDELFEANRTYQIGMEIRDQMDQAIGRKDSRRLISLTDFIMGSGGALGGDPTLGVATVAAKKVLEVAKPRVGLYGKEIAQGLSKPIKSTITQQATQSVTHPDSTPIKDKVQGTKYASMFGDDPQKNAVNHKVLMSQDEEYRKQYMKKEEE